ncbi:MAG TPA: DUF559 domain-containing protein [Mycobacteriales bacterium]|nr:DUF559 domain-containing protein [Mycobacteriales bacterium]
MRTDDWDYRATSGALFTRADALAAGYTPRQIEGLLRRGAWRAIRAGVYLDLAAGSSLDDLTLRTSAALLRLGPDAAASHHTAALLRSISLLGPRPASLDVTRPTAPGRTPANLPGVRALRAGLPPTHVVVVDGVRQTAPSRTVFDLARTTSFRAGVVTADSALHQGLTSVGELRTVADDCRRWPGRLRALKTIDFAEPLSESALESVSRVMFRVHDLPMPRSQVDLGDNDGAIGRVDFLWEAFGVIGEADGRVKYANAEDLLPLWAEKQRQERLEEAGFIVVRWTWRQVFNEPERTIRRIAAALNRGTARRSA